MWKLKMAHSPGWKTMEHAVEEWLRTALGAAAYDPAR
jgi:hypothetical protein